jgi:enoyl-CoA hydratase
MTKLPSMTLTRVGNVATITFSRPELRNAVTLQWLDDIKRLVANLQADAGVRAVVITGSGSAFCAGGDLDALTRMRSADDLIGYLGNVQSAFAAIEGLEKPVVAAVNGHALGGGCELLMCCDVVVAQADAKIGLPELLVGATPGAGGLTRLPRVVGTMRAREIVLLGRPLSAERALQMGLVSEVTDAASLYQRAAALASELAERPPLAVAIAKRLINRAHDVALTEALECEAKSAAALWGTTDHAEGLRAFQERRRPVFVGR